ncbi:MAG: hypothetical protein JWP57_1538 [Spirosoma sp.]|nr:hypothetical protein [Spirosoma sp.]
MTIQALSQRFATAQAALHKFMAPPPEPTIAQLLADYDLSPLLEAIEAARPYNCLSVEYIDDYERDGQHRFVFDATYLAGICYDEDGSYPEEFKDRITLDVAPTISVPMLVFLLNDNIRNLIEA